MSPLLNIIADTVEFPYSTFNYLLQSMKTSAVVTNNLRGEFNSAFLGAHPHMRTDAAHKEVQAL
jgi:hypothetical protein